MKKNRFDGFGELELIELTTALGARSRNLAKAPDARAATLLTTSKALLAEAEDALRQIPCDVEILGGENARPVGGCDCRACEAEAVRKGLK